MLVAGGDQLSKTARTRIGASPGELHVSAITAFELGVKCRKGALLLPLPPDEWYERALEFHGIRELPVSGRIALTSTSLPAHHADPCDRMIVATAALDDLTIRPPTISSRPMPKPAASGRAPPSQVTFLAPLDHPCAAPYRSMRRSKTILRSILAESVSSTVQ